MAYLIFWGVIFVLAVMAEVLTLQLTSIWFAVGAAGAFAGAFFGLGLTGQLAIFVLVSFFLLIITRPLLSKLKVKKAPPMNAEKDIGSSAVVIQEVNPDLGTGRVRVNGVDWIAVSDTGEILPEKSIVTVIRIDGAKLIVR